MRVLVVATSESCPAILALRSELIEYDYVPIEDDLSYGRTLHEYWERGEGFVNIEHDVVPWFGAVKSLMGCEYGFCTHQYPIGHSGKLQTALGLVKFSDDLIRDNPNANFGWDLTSWRGLDAQVYGALQLDRGIKPDIHVPPVAHLKPFEQPALSLSQIAMRCT